MDQAQLPEPPQTGNRELDATLAGLAGLDEADVAEQHRRLAEAQDVLARVLEHSRGQVPGAVPQGLRPNGGR